MKRYFQNYKYLRTELKNLLYVAITLILFIEFIGFDYEEIFPKANVIANIFLKICYSYVSALIFYYLIVHYKRQDEKRKFYAVINTKLNSFILEHDRIHINISKLNNNNKFFDIRDKENLKESLKNVNPHNTYEGVIYINSGKVTWLTHLHIVAENTKNEIEKIYLQSFLLEVELIKNLDNLNNNSLFQQVRLFVNASITNQDFETFFEAFYNYSEVIENLKEYQKKEIQKYL